MASIARCSLHGLLLLIVVTLSLRWGYQLRQWTWEYTEGAHFQNSLHNAIRWGHYTNQVGVVNVYEILVKEHGEEGRFTGAGVLPLDYPPLRLLIMSRWEAWTAKHFRPTFDPNSRWQPQYQFTLPMLLFNTGCELAGAVVMFVLVRYWLRHCAGLPAVPWIEPTRGLWPGVLAALLVWFNPAAIFNAHGYIQWDVWMFAPFLLAVYLGLRNQWLLAGICIGAIALGKGQVLLVTPVLAIWQLFTLRPRAVPFVILFGGIIVALWILSNDFLPLLVIYLGVGSALVMLLFRVLLPWTPLRIGLGVVFAFEIYKSLLVAAVEPFSQRWIMILGAPVLIAWVILSRNTASTLRLLVGIALAIGCVASPWMVSNDSSFAWIGTVFVALQLLVTLGFNRSWSRYSIILHVIAIATAAQLVLWPWAKTESPDSFWWAMLGLIALILAARFLPKRWAPTWFCGAIAVAIFACVPLFNTSMAWYDVGIKFGTRNRQLLTWMKPMNLAAILEENYNWDWADKIDLAAYLPWLHEPYVIPMRYLMIGAYLLCMVLCGFGMAMHQRRRSPQFFFAMVAPWVLLFALMPQMLNRYLIWGAVFSAATAAFSVEGLLICILLSTINVFDTAIDMFNFGRGSPISIKWWTLVVPMYPGMSWGVLLLAAIWLYLALKPGRRGTVDRVQIAR